MYATALLRRLKQRLFDNAPGLTVAMIALVFAMLGGAYAAQSSNSGKATASAKVKKGATGPRGPKGPKGATGPAGPQGPAGLAGAKGDKGDNGVPGAAGPKGSTGPTGPTGTAGATGPTGPTGATGPQGEEGEPWTELGVLPPGKMETGSWAFAASTSDTAGIKVPISFAIPLGSKLQPEQVHFQEDADFETFCSGTPAVPNPNAGELCVYRGEVVENTTFKGIYPPGTGLIESEEGEGANRAGAMLVFAPPTGAATSYGTFAVRAAEP